MKPLLIILDIDETLIHATELKLEYDCDFEVGDYKVYKRPGLDQFLHELKTNYKVAVWSSATKSFVDEVVKQIFPENYPLEFIWHREMCTRQINYKEIEECGYSSNSHLNYAKVIKKVKKKFGFPLERMIIIDDTPLKARHNYGNVIYPKIFKGDMNDDELNHLLVYLDMIKDIENVRKIEKRNWKSKIVAANSAYMKLTEE